MLRVGGEGRPSWQRGNNIALVPFGTLTPEEASSSSSSLQLDQLHIEYEGGVGGDDPWVTRCSISHVWCAGDLSPLAQAHLCNSFLPTLDDLLSPDLELEGLISVSRRVKLLSILEHSCVMNNTRLALLWKSPSISRRYVSTSTPIFTKIIWW